MLTEMRNDRPDILTKMLLTTSEPEPLFSLWRHATEQIGKESHTTLSADLGKDLTVLMVGEILARIAVKMGISSGILGVGTISATGTFGVGLAAAVIVDVAVSWIWNWYAEPNMKLAATIHEQLDMIRHLDETGMLIQTYGQKAIPACKQINRHNSRRLVQMHTDGDLARIARTDELLGVIAKQVVAPVLEKTDWSSVFLFLGSTVLICFLILQMRRKIRTGANRNIG